MSYQSPTDGEEDRFSFVPRLNEQPPASFLVDPRVWRKCTEEGAPPSASEYLILTDVASRLGTYLPNRISPSVSPKMRPSTPNLSTSDVDSVFNEAQLLLSFMSSTPSPDILDSAGCTSVKTISPSLSFETKNHCFRSVGQKPLPENCAEKLLSQESQGHRLIPSYSKAEGDSCFSVICQSLSLSKDSQFHPSKNKDSTAVQLLSRPLIISKLTIGHAVKEMADTLAFNLMSTLKTALNWRAKVWISMLLKYLKIKHARMRKCSRGSECDGDKAFMSSKGTDLDINCGSEVRVIQALRTALSSVSISDIRTTFQVLEQRLLVPQTSASFEGCSRTHEEKLNISGQESFTYKLARVVSMESTLTVSNHLNISTVNCDLMNMNIHTPGVIQGTFVRSLSGKVSLIQVDLLLDINIMAIEIEKHTRRIIRSFAKENIISSSLYPEVSLASSVKGDLMAEESSKSDANLVPGLPLNEFDPNPIHSIRQDSQVTDTPIPTYRDDYGAHPIVTPRQVSCQSLVAGTPPSSPSSTSSVEFSSSHLLSPNGKRKVSDLYLLQPRRVSPSIIHSETVVASSTNLRSRGNETTITCKSSCPNTFDHLPFIDLPSVITPNPVTETDKFEEKIFAKNANGPSLPWLADVVCGSVVM